MLRAVVVSIELNHTSQIVPLARHSTLPELQRFVSLFKPKRVVPNTVLPKLGGADWACIPVAFGPCMAPGGAERVKKDMIANGYGIWVEADSKGTKLQSAHDAITGASPRRFDGYGYGNTSDHLGSSSGVVAHPAAAMALALSASTMDNFIGPSDDASGSQGIVELFSGVLGIDTSASSSLHDGRKSRTLEHLTAFSSRSVRFDDRSFAERIFIHVRPYSRRRYRQRYALRSTANCCVFSVETLHRLN